MIYFLVIAWIVVGIVVTSIMVRLALITSEDSDVELAIVMSIIAWPVVLVLGVATLLVELVLWLGGDR